MSGDEKQPSDEKQPAIADPQAIPPAKRRSLQICFKTGMRNVEQGNYKYAAMMLSQSVVGDPWSVEYLKAFLDNLHAQYSNKKPGGTLAALKGAVPKSKLNKAVKAKDWQAAIKAGVELLNLNPWDVSALVAMADACEGLGSDECQLLYLREALATNPKDPELNKVAALALARQGDFAQAITCWHRVEQARPGDEEALKMIGQLTIERTMPRTEYEEKRMVRNMAVQERKEATAAGETISRPPAAEQEVELTREQKLLLAIQREPEQESHYLELGEVYLLAGKLDQAEEMLRKALAISGGANMQIVERLEDFRIQRMQNQVEIAEKRAAEEKTEEAAKLVKRMKNELNRVELEVCAARYDRTPGSDLYHYELGVRLKRATQFKEAIKHFQVSRPESKYKSAVFLELGECFQFIKQYKLAMTNYVRAVEECGERGSDIHKRALYRASVLATGLEQYDMAEKYLTELAGIDFGYRDVADRLDKLNELRHNT